MIVKRCNACRGEEDITLELKRIDGWSGGGIPIGENQIWHLCNVCTKLALDAIKGRAN